MARIRTIKPEFWSDEKLSPLSPIDRLTFLGLISLADDYGRVQDNTKILDAFIFPNTDDTVRESVANLSRISRIRRGNSSNGMKIIEIVNWDRHQRVDKPQPKLALPSIAEQTNENIGENAIPESFANSSGIIRELVAPLTTTTTNDQRSNMSDSYESDFEAFWDSYPRFRRTQKKAAYAKWKVARKYKSADYLNQRCKDYAASQRGQSEFACMPSVWLGSGMWDDPPEAWLLSTGKNGSSSQAVTQPEPPKEKIHERQMRMLAERRAMDAAKEAERLKNGQ